MHDVLIIGGGAAGLNAASVLGRFRRDVLVVDAGEPRNAPAEGVHNFLSRDGMPPSELLAIGREQAKHYGVRFQHGSVTGARRIHGGFAVETTGGAVEARRILLATGLMDELPTIEGVRERWGHDVIHCPYCHGWEVRDRAIGVFSPHQAQLFRLLSDDVTLFTREEVEVTGVTVVRQDVRALVVEDDVLRAVRLADGSVRPLDVLSVATRLIARAGMLEGIGVVAQEHSSGMGTHVPVGPTGATEVAGVWAAGNVSDPMAQVITAAAQGLQAAAAIIADLLLTPEGA